MYRLLIADDEMIERKVLFKTLSQNLKGQCEIFQAENGREALEIYEKEKIHPKSVQQPEHRRKNVQDQPLYEPVQRTFGVKHSDQGAVYGAAF